MTLTVAEPAITIAKTASAGGAADHRRRDDLHDHRSANAAGANAAPAFDLVLGDPLPAPFTSVGARTITSSGATGVVDTTSGTTVGATIARLDPGGSVTIAFTATAPGPLAPGALTNTANADVDEPARNQRLRGGRRRRRPARPARPPASARAAAA